MIYFIGEMLFLDFGQDTCVHSCSMSLASVTLHLIQCTQEDCRYNKEKQLTNSSLLNSQNMSSLSVPLHKFCGHTSYLQLIYM